VRKRRLDDPERAEQIGVELRARLLRGLELLAEGQSVTTVALELGYCNISAFIALFKRTFGVTPTRYMRNT